jgi:hypothetical protein
MFSNDLTVNYRTWLDVPWSLFRETIEQKLSDEAFDLTMVALERMRRSLPSFPIYLSFIYIMNGRLRVRDRKIVELYKFFWTRKFYNLFIYINIYLNMKVVLISRYSLRSK